MGRDGRTDAAFDVGAALDVGLGEHADDAEQDLLDALHRRPTLRGRLVHVRVVAGRVEDGDADLARGVDVGVEQRGLEGHLRDVSQAKRAGGTETYLWRGEGVIGGEGEDGGKDAALERRLGRAGDEGFPDEEVVLVQRS